jgi:CO/xanthine dehydrogenase Mo-binding subunit
MSGIRASRRQVGKMLGIVVVSFAFRSTGSQAQSSPSLPFDLKANPKLDSWIRLEPDETVTVFTGKAELGQGILTALAQIAAEELDIDIGLVRMVSADTTRSPNETYTFGSQSIENGGSALRAAAAEARAIIVDAAARHFEVPAATLRTAAGMVSTSDGRQATYWNAVGGDPALFTRQATASISPKQPRDFRLVGKSIPRLDLPAKLTATASYLQDMRLPGMVFGRSVRPPRQGATLLSVNDAEVGAMPGVIAIVRDGSFLGVVAAREEVAIAARQALIDGSRWSNDGITLPDRDHLSQQLQQFSGEITTITADKPSAETAAKRLDATYARPYLSHGSIGPSCAAAWLKDGHMTVWSQTQGAYPLRGDLATVLGMDPKQVDVIHTPAAGCYGHNGADDAALDAALLARAVEGRPVKLQWMRDDEFVWAPISPAMVIKVTAGLSAENRVVDWNYDLWSNSHAMRPGQPGGVNLLAAWYLPKPFNRSPPLRIPQPYGDGDRNAIPPYAFEGRTIKNHLLMDTPIRNSSLRSLGAFGNVFAIESFMDELAVLAEMDPVEFRLLHLKDPRAIAVLKAAAAKAGWDPNLKGDGTHGRGVSYSRYKNIGTYAAAVVNIEVDRKTGVVKVPKVVIAVDVGQIINPDGVKNQIEGGVVQAISFALKEQVTFDREKITSHDWQSYPILTFPEVPSVDVVLLDQPSERSLGAGEGSIGPTGAAVANAFAHATGRRCRDLPMRPDRVKSLLS